MSCPTDDKFVISNKDCLKCDPSCKTCLNNSKLGCISCEALFYRK